MSDRGEESHPDRGFKVEDRRRFAPTGEPRAEGAETAAQELPEPEVSAEPQRPVESGPATAPPVEITFSAFIISLSTQALVHLGEIPNPLGEESAVELGAAQQLIDILGVLRDKTQGNLDPTEKSLLDSVLYDLRLRFVERAKRGAPS